MGQPPSAVRVCLEETAEGGCPTHFQNSVSFLNDPIRRRCAGDDLGDRGPVEDRAFRLDDIVPDGRQGAGGGMVRVSGRFGRSVDRAENFTNRDLFRGPGQSIAAGGASGAMDQAGAFELQEDLDEVTLWDLKRLGDLPDPERGIVGSSVGQGQHRQASVLSFRGNSHERSQSTAQKKRNSRQPAAIIADFARPARLTLPHLIPTDQTDLAHQFQRDSIATDKPPWVEPGAPWPAPRRTRLSHIMPIKVNNGLARACDFRCAEWDGKRENGCFCGER